jgi:integrase
MLRPSTGKEAVMPRKPIYPPPVRHNKARNQDYVRIAGRQIYLGPHDSDKARGAYARVLAEHAGGVKRPAPAGPAPPVSVVVESWLTAEAPRYADRGRERGQFLRVLTPLVRLYGPSPAAAFGWAELAALQQALASGSWMTDAERGERLRRKQPVGWCARVVNRQVVRVRTVWRWAERAGLVPPGRYAHLLSVSGLRAGDARVRHHAPVKPASWDDVRRVARCCHPAARAILLLCWWTGCRPGEARVLRPRDLDRAGPVWLYRPHRHKNEHRGQSRIVPLNKRAQAVLGPWLKAAAPDAYLFTPEPRRDGYRAALYTCFSLAQAIRRGGEKAGVAGLNLYRLRHSAKDRVTAQCGLDAARAFLGQKSILTTDGYGTTTDVRLAVEAAARLGGKKS